MNNKLKAFRLPTRLIKKLKQLSTKTHRSETFYVVEALTNYLEDYEDALIAVDRLQDPGTEYVTSKELRDRLGL